MAIKRGVFNDDNYIEVYLFLKISYNYHCSKIQNACLNICGVDYLKYSKKVLSIIVTVIILIGMVAPSLQPSFAASNDVFDPSFTYNTATGRWDITWTPIDGAISFVATWHNPDGSEGRFPSESTSEITDGKVSLTFRPDHIYDLTFSFKDQDEKDILFRNKYNELVDSETIFFLADITFEGTSFNDRGGLLDNKYVTDNGDPDKPATRIISGHEPQITLKWKVPTIYDSGKIIYITEKNEDVYDKLKADNTANISFSYFHIRMNEITDRQRSINFRTTYNDSGVIIKETGKQVVGFDAEGVVDGESGFVTCTLNQSDGIKAGTEYSNIDIRLFFWDENEEREVYFSKLVYGYGSGKGFPIVNKDIVFRNIDNVNSIFTPMHFEVSKVDVDKMEVRIKKIKNSNYPKLYYQVQEAGAVSDFLEGHSNLSGGIKMPDSSIPDNIGWGSIIIEVPLNENGEHPQYYYRVIVTDGDSNTPLGSLAIDLSILDNDTGTPPVPREINVQPIYGGKQKITVNGTDVKVPLTNIRIYFEKPLFWDNSEDSDLTFHVLLNTYLSDNVRESETKVIGEPEVTVRLPVTERRVATFGKDNIEEDERTGMLYFELDGDNLFHDFHSGQSLDFENDKDYPNFLIPNTKYYLRMFSTWADDNDKINWADGNMDKLSQMISYISPVVSFTTYPTQDMPIPVPSFNLDISPKDELDPETGKPVFSGITVDFAKILKNEDWRNYTEVLDGRKIEYKIFISRNNEVNSYQLVDRVVTTYPDDNPDAVLSTLITNLPSEDGEAFKPNTTYYFKMQAILYVDDEDSFLIGDETPAKSITTPKTDSGSMDDIERLPRTPVEFSIATDSNGELELTDAKVTLSWLHAEQDVTYEMVCTTKKLDANASLDDYIRDEYHIGEERNPGFLTVYKDYKTKSADTELNIDVLNTKLYDLGFTYNENGNRIARFPINLPFLKPNQLYYFSIRAVRDRGTDAATYSKWVSIPVTTKMVAAPKFLEAVNDVQLGFNMTLSGGIAQEDIRVMLKKAHQPDDSYVEMSRAKYSVVRDGRRYYFRLYDLEPDTWYDIQPFYSNNDNIVWYDSDDEDWSSRDREPIRMKTRNTLNEIEIRFEGESVYDYFIEVRTDYSEDYIQLVYDRKPEDSDYGYIMEDDKIIEFYREKTQAYVDDTQSDKYMYYAKIYQARQKRSDGRYVRDRLLSNTRYYIKIWARNEADSSRVGPVTVRTDFNQKDYDDDYKRDEITDMFESKADKLTRKLYFTVDELDKYSNRILLKGAMISNYMKVADHSGITIDISKEKPDAMKDIIIVPMEILETLQTTTSRLTIKLSGCELTLTKDSLNLEDLKKPIAQTGVRETMLEITVQRKQEGSVRPSPELTYGSDVYDIEFSSLSMRRTYAQMNEIIYDILKEPGVSGPFKYGILDSELNKLLEKRSVLSYQSYTDIENVIELAVQRVEEQLSLYIKDILDGGRGLSASVIKRSKLPELKGGIRLKILQDGSSGLAEPYVLLHNSRTWSKPMAVKGWAFPYIFFTAKVPGEYTVFNAPRIILPETDGFVDLELKRLSEEYDLRKIFGTTLYPGDYISADTAVNLFEAITNTQSEVAGLSAPAKIRYFNLDEFIPPSLVNQVLNRGQANSLVVEIYAFKTGVPSDMMRPSTFMHITNGDKIPDAIYNRLIIALDLGVTELETDYSYKYESKATIEQTLHSIITVLELLGEW